MKTIEEVRAFFSNDRFATENGMVIEEVSDGYAKCSLKIETRHENAVGQVMGGVAFTLADFCYAVATNHDEPKWVSLSSNITYLGRAKGERLVAEATRQKEGRSTNYYLVSVTDDLGNPVAHVNISGFCKN